MGALAGKVVVVVGGTTGLGRSAARACADAGARVVIVGRMERLNGEKISHRQAAKELGIGYATLKRLLDSGYEPSGPK